MAQRENPIERDFEQTTASASSSSALPGRIGNSARQYEPNSPHLLGFLLKLNYEEMDIVTCDAWKRQCGGVPRNSFVVVRVSPARVAAQDHAFSDRLILARITDSVPSHFYKVIFDPLRVEAIAFIVPNAPNPTRRLARFIESVDAVEAATGLDFLARLDDRVERLIEGQPAAGLWAVD